MRCCADTMMPCKSTAIAVSDSQSCKFRDWREQNYSTHHDVCCRSRVPGLALGVASLICPRPFADASRAGCQTSQKVESEIKETCSVKIDISQKCAGRGTRRDGPWSGTPGPGHEGLSRPLRHGPRGIGHKLGARHITASGNPCAVWRLDDDVACDVQWGLRQPGRPAGRYQELSQRYGDGDGSAAG